MGGATSFKPIFNVTFPFFLIIITTTVTLIGPLIVAETDDDSKETPLIPSLEDNNGTAIATVAAVTAPLPPLDASTRNSSHFTKRSEQFKPSTAMVVGILTTMFSLTFLLLLYIKNCNGGNVHANGNNQEVASSNARMNSGISRAIVELLPIFRFRSLSGRKEGLDCAVCLMRFEDPEVLRLLPKCKHAFHVECVDKWLHAHSTCPLCRYKVESKDIATPQREKETEEEEEEEKEEEEPFDIENGTRRVPGRHSSVTGAEDSVYLEIVMQNSNENKTMLSSRSKSLDDASRTFRGNFVCPKRDDKSLKQQNNNNNNNNDNTHISQRRLEHRIIIDSPSSPSVNYNGDGGSHQHLWSEAGPSNSLYLTSEMITRNASISWRHLHSVQAPPRQWSPRRARRTVHSHAVSDGNENIGSSGGCGVSLRSVSEVTRLGRFLSGGSRRSGSRSRSRGRERQHGGREEQDRRQHTRWSAWISRSQKSQGDVR